jgi:urease gamma subunit
VLSLVPLFSLSLLLSISPSLLLSLPFRAAAHKFHFSFTQIEYNAPEKTAEITLRVFADDLEQALSQRRGKAVKLDHKDAAALVAAYVRDTLELKGRDGRIKKLTWIGMEAKVDVALLYIEAKLPDGVAGLQLRQRVFFELFDDQVNQVSLKAADRKASLEFKSGEGFKVLSFGAK